MSTIRERVDAYKRAVASEDVFDMALWWAPQHTDGFVTYDDWDRQMEAHAGFGLRGGLVTPHTAANYDPYIGNDELPALLKGRDSLYGCIVVTPDMFFKPGRGEEYLRCMKERRAVAARMFPGKYTHSTREYAVGRMLDALEEAGMPLLVWHVDTGWDAIDRMLTNHPGLKVVVESMDRKLLYHARDYTALLIRHGNFYLETHNLVLFNEFEVLREYAGCDRLLYGSYFPYMTPDFSLYPVLAADIPQDVRRGILAGNARKLLGIA